jgi:hypothetical protein
MPMQWLCLELSQTSGAFHTTSRNSNAIPINEELIPEVFYDIIRATSKYHIILIIT